MNKRFIGLSDVTRLSLFSEHKGPAVLITTEERLDLFKASDLFNSPASINPFIQDWSIRKDKVVLSFEQAIKAFPNDPDALQLRLELNQSYPREQLLENFLDYGFERDDLPGFSIRGDTITLYFEEDESHNLRLEFFGDELDNIKYKDNDVKSFDINPLPDVELSDESWTAKLIEKLDGPLFLDAPELYYGEVSELESDQERLAWFWQHCRERQCVSFGRDELDLSEEKSPLTSLGYYRGKLKEFAEEAETWLKDGYSINLILRFERTGRYLQEKVIDHLNVAWGRYIKHEAGTLRLIFEGNTRGGYKDDSKKQIVLTEDLLYAYQGTRSLKRLPGKKVSDATQLSIGDYLVHPESGIGRFLGLEPRTVLGVTRDYLILQYAGEGKIYLPIDQLPLLRRHPGTTDTPPRLSTLGTNEWARAKEKARASAQALALKLIKVYAERQIVEGESLGPVEGWYEQIDASFEFELTADQARAIDEVLADMEKPHPMDRLVSGDVGFGKTEVAIRAAHRAVGNQKQVALLVPTTVLAKQHYETLFERYKDMPVVVEMLSRFSSTKEVQSTLQGLKSGSVDIVIGTHKLLSDGIIFKDLGLLIIDEEHRFGVAQKERIKGFKANVDILSLSATPIPRTLYMSMVGLRDISQITTPPQGRKPIQTVLQPYNPNAIRDAVMFELERGGKAFYIHDRIGSMGSRAMILQTLIPEARIGVAHGQMSGAELEEVMVAFEDGAYDLLLSTTIIESGIDIGKANTLIVERADRLGLAQLYQLRGRVGRRQTEAWAYLLYPGKLTEQAQRRLYAIAELNDLGSGHLLAEKDMEIRGVGNLLGPEQHGQVNAVSLSVYTELLAEEIAKLKGEVVDKTPPAKIDISLDARISPTYIADDEARITFYGRISDTKSLAEIGRIRNELRANFGPIPEEVKNFMELAKLRILATQKGVSNINEHMTDIEITFHQDGVENLDYDAQGLKKLPQSIEVTSYPPGFSIKKRGIKQEELSKVLSDVLYLCS